jgi:hypothetical protein
MQLRDKTRRKTKREQEQPIKKKEPLVSRPGISGDYLE